MSELAAHGYNAYWVLKKDDKVKLVRWREFDDQYVKDGWEIVDFFRANTRTEAQIRAVQHGDL